MTQELPVAGPADAGSPDALGECKKIHAEPELLSYWKTLPAPSNERLAVEIIETLQGELAQSSSRILSLESRLKEAEERAKVNQEDAERYRWLRSNKRLLNITIEQFHPQKVTLHDEFADAAIDAALKDQDHE